MLLWITVAMATELADCRAIVSPSQRLRCYDELADASAAEATPTPPTPPAGAATSGAPSAPAAPPPAVVPLDITPYPAWTSTERRDAFTGTVSRGAMLRAVDDGAHLVVLCTGPSGWAVGFMPLSYVGIADLSVGLKFDDLPPTYVNASPLTDGRGVFVMDAAALVRELLGFREMLVRIRPAYGPTVNLRFHLEGAAAAVAQASQLCGAP